MNTAFNTGLLTAFIQTPPGTTPEMFGFDPLGAAMLAATHHLKFAAQNDVGTVELAAAHSPRTANVPPERMADPVGCHTAIETNRDGRGGIELSDENTIRLVEACQGGRTIVGTLGAFENCLSENPMVRKQNLEHMRRCIRAAAKIAIAQKKPVGVTMFVGRDLGLSISDNLRLFAKVFVPLIRYAKQHNVIVYIENCPMCGWADHEASFIQNIASTVENQIVMARIIEAAGLKGWCFLNYDPSHDILIGTRPESTFGLLAAAGYGWFIGRFHGKDLVRLPGRIAAAGFNGSRLGGTWGKMGGDQPAPGATKYDPRRIAEGLQVDWLGMFITAIEELELPAEIVFTTEFEQTAFRDREKYKSPEHQMQVCGDLMLASIAFTKSMWDAAVANYRAMELVSATQRDNNNIVWCGTWDFLDGLCTIPNTDGLWNAGGRDVVQSALDWQIPDLSDTADLVLE